MTLSLGKILLMIKFFLFFVDFVFLFSINIKISDTANIPTITIRKSIPS